MATPKGSGVPQHSFFHTPVSLSPLAAVVNTAGQSSTKTVHIPQRKLDVTTDESWGPWRILEYIFVCVGVVYVVGGWVFFFFSPFLTCLAFTQYSLPLKTFHSSFTAFILMTASSKKAGLSRYSSTLPSCSLWCLCGLFHRNRMAWGEM